jgi:hypothetical protein
MTCSQKTKRSVPRSPGHRLLNVQPVIDRQDEKLNFRRHLSAKSNYMQSKQKQKMDLFNRKKEVALARFHKLERSLLNRHLVFGRGRHVVHLKLVNMVLHPQGQETPSLAI